MNKEKFLEIETKYNLYELSVDGVQYWNYCRFSIWNYNICSEQLGLAESHKENKKSLLKQIKQIFEMTYNTIFKSKVPKKNVDILFLNHARRIWNCENYECAYTEKLSKKFKNSVTLEMPYEYKHFVPTNTHNLIYADYIIVLANLYYKIIKILAKNKYKKLLNLVKLQLREPIKEFREAYNWQVNEQNIYNKVTRTILLYKIKYKLYENLLKKINPKMIIEVVYYTSHNMIINEIAKNKQIPIIELQHGNMYPEHLAYQYSLGCKIKQFPDKIFLFSDFWKKNIQVPIKEENLIVTGYPLFEEKRNMFNKKNIKKNQKTLLFISQGTIGSYLSKLAVEVIKLLEKENFYIIYKLHPGEYQSWEETYPWLKNERIKVIFDSKKNIYDYFAISDIQIGVYSTAIYEGLGFNLQTLILRVGHYEIMQPLIEAGYAQYVDNATDIVKYIRKNQNTCLIEQEFWKSNALKNMELEIKKILTSS